MESRMTWHIIAWMMCTLSHPPHHTTATNPNHPGILYTECIIALHAGRDKWRMQCMVDPDHVGWWIPDSDFSKRSDSQIWVSCLFEEYYLLGLEIKQRTPWRRIQNVNVIYSFCEDQDLNSFLGWLILFEIDRIPTTILMRDIWIHPQHVSPPRRHRPEIPGLIYGFSILLPVCLAPTFCRPRT